jgi:hypothetical protein
MMYNVTRRLNVTAVLRVLLGTSVLLAGCSTSPVGGDSGLDDGATIELSAVPGELLVIEEDEGVGSTLVYGDFSAVDGEPDITGFTVDGGDDLIGVSLNEEGLPDEVTAGSITLLMQYNSDGSFDYQIYESGTLVWEGTNIYPESTTFKTINAKWTPITELEVFDCAVNQVAEWASLAIARLQPAQAGGSVEAHPLTDCLKNNNAVWDLALTSCVLLQSLQRRLNAAQELRGEDKTDAINYVVAILLGVVPRVLTGLDGAVADIANQLWSDPACRDTEDRPGCTDTCPYAYDGVCDDGGPGSQYAVCELGTDCTDCGPREPTDDSDSDSQQASCGDGICDAAAGEMTSCPEDCPNNCGDGICNHTAGEMQSCPQDCPEEQCCVETNGCPSEGLYDCPGDCCCCAYGARCVYANSMWVCGI